jgi:hypothetical protein
MTIALIYWFKLDQFQDFLLVYLGLTLKVMHWSEDMFLESISLDSKLKGITFWWFLHFNLKIISCCFLILFRFKVIARVAMKIRR